MILCSVIHSTVRLYDQISVYFPDKTEKKVADGNFEMFCRSKLLVNLQTAHANSMSDSETHCSDESTTCCESPVLDIGNGSLPYSESNRMGNDAGFSTIFALNALDSMLEHPASQPLASEFTEAARDCVPPRSTKPTKSRSIHEVLNRLPPGRPTAHSLYTQMDMVDIRLLLNACGAKPPGSNLTKASAVQQLVVFIENGELLNLRNQLTKPPSLHVSRQLLRQAPADEAASRMADIPSHNKQTNPVASSSADAKKSAPAVQWLVADDAQQWQPLLEGINDQIHGLYLPRHSYMHLNICVQGTCWDFSMERRHGGIRERPSARCSSQRCRRASTSSTRPRRTGFPVTQVFLLISAPRMISSDR